MSTKNNNQEPADVALMDGDVAEPDIDAQRRAQRRACADAVKKSDAVVDEH